MPPSPTPSTHARCEPDHRLCLLSQQTKFPRSSRQGGCHDRFFATLCLAIEAPFVRSRHSPHPPLWSLPMKLSRRTLARLGRRHCRRRIPSTVQLCGPVRPVTSSARSPSATRAGSPAPATEHRSTAGGTGATTGASRRRRATPRSSAGRTFASTRATYQTAYANLGNGQPAQLFSSYDQQTVNTHFQWMQQNGCDTAALQRFNPTGGEGPTRDAMAVKVRQAAETVRAQVLHHVRRHRLDEHAVGDEDRLDQQDAHVHVVPGVRAAERQAGRLHLGLRLQRTEQDRGRPRSAWMSSTGSRPRAAT